MKIVIHGAISGTNFGDFLFANMFFDKISTVNTKGENLFFEFPKIGLSTFFRREMNYTKKISTKDIFTSDMLVYISGGYFGERSGSLKENIIRIIRYAMLGGIFRLRNKPIIIIGIGGGPLSNKLLRYSMCKLLAYASLVTVRDNETADYFKSYGLKKELIVTSDTAQLVSSDKIPNLDIDVHKSVASIFRDKKIIFFHLNNMNEKNSIFKDDFINALNSFLDRHNDYGVIIGSDEDLQISNYEAIIREKINTDAFYMYSYKNPWQLCALLDKVDLIITPKLHVGIIGATLSKSVISFSIHYEKVRRYYKQIGEQERCIPFDLVSQEIIEKQLEKFHEKKIRLDQTILEAANQNFEMLENRILSEIQEGSC